MEASRSVMHMERVGTGRLRPFVVGRRWILKYPVKPCGVPRLCGLGRVAGLWPFPLLEAEGQPLEDQPALLILWCSRWTEKLQMNAARYLVFFSFLHTKPAFFFNALVGREQRVNIVARQTELSSVAARGTFGRPSLTTQSVPHVSKFYTGGHRQGYLP